MNSKHVTYVNSTIIEAACELSFQLNSGQKWEPSILGEFFKSIQKEYPTMEPVIETALQFEVSQQSVGQKMLAPRQIMRFKHKERPLLIQLSKNTLAINTLKPYLGWEKMCADILGAWQKVKDVLSVSEINRIGLRYINRIDRETDQDRPKDWLKCNDYLPQKALSSQAGFLSRVEIKLDNENRIIVILGDTKPNNDSTHGTIMFDIDRVLEKKISSNEDVLKSEINKLHLDIWEVFSSAKNEKLEGLLNKGSSL